jgi:hypothetical protein
MDFTNAISGLAPLLASSGPNLGKHLYGISGFLGGYYLVLAAMNGIMALYLWQKRDDASRALTWIIVSMGYVILSPLAMSGHPDWVPQFPHAVTETINWLTNPTIYTVGTIALLAILFLFRSFFVQPMVAWTILNLMLLAMGFAMADPNFADIVTKPDNVPIVAMVYLLAYFTWLATYYSVLNDERLARGEPPLEKLDDEKVLVWPDLVYTELICMVGLAALLLTWALVLQAPLEEPASSVKTPNPSKAPWYFLGLQEMLVYFDPWYAGVVLPSMIIVGLMAIPYLDFNKDGNGYYTINQRKFAYLTFQFGFLVLWVTLIILGTFLRGPNWNIFGPFEYWDPHKLVEMNNVDLSQYFWVKWLDMPMPRAPEGAGTLSQFGFIILRELPGILAVLAYLVILPPLMAVTVFRTFFVKMGFIRYMLMTNLLLLMMSLPIKMILRWTVDLKYIISIPEYFLNF